MAGPSRWNWQIKGWPGFRFDGRLTEDLELALQKHAGLLLGIWRHLDTDEKGQLTVEVLSSEAMTTSAIEGEHLDLRSVQSSLQRQFGLTPQRCSPKPAEEGVAELMIAMYRDYDTRLSKDTLCTWHKMLCNGRRDLQMIGDYRSHPEAMVIISGNPSEPTIHYEAPPSAKIPAEMDAFIRWYHQSGPGGSAPLQHYYGHQSPTSTSSRFIPSRMATVVSGER